MKWLLLFVSACAVLSTGCCGQVNLTGVPDDIANNVFIYLMQGPNATYNVKIPLLDGLSIPNYSFFNASRETVFYFHGWGESASVTSVTTIANAFLTRNTSNLAIFDYSVLVKADTDTQYVESFVNATYIGSAIGQFLQQFVEDVQDKQLLHLVSHSLGSQIMSKVARTYGSGELPWLTGLDPAGPLFEIPGVDHLDSSDAVFVDVIHTDAGFYGDYRSIGTVNFFPNGGSRVQPYCEHNITDFCSHHMSWRFYAESIRNPLAFPAKKCYRNIFCDGNLSFCICLRQQTYIGYNVDKSQTGNYYLTTNSQQPFGRGQNGTEFGTDEDVK